MRRSIIPLLSAAALSAMLFSCPTTLGQIAANELGNVANINSILFVDGIKYTTVQQAITALPSSGGTVVIPCGIYTFSDTTLNKSNLTIRGSGSCTQIQPSGGAGHYAFILGDANPSTVGSLQLHDLSIQCPGGGDLTSGILVRKGVSVGTVLDNLKIRGCATHVLWGETTGGSIGSFDGTMQYLDIDLVGTEIGIHISNGSNGPNGLNITNCSIRNGTLDPNASVGILIEGQAFRTSILDNYIEFMPGGDIVLRSTNGTTGNTIISGNYMETYGPNGFLLDVGTGVVNTVFANNYTQSNELVAPYTTPTPYDIQIADGVSGIFISNVTMQNHGTANIHNLNTNPSARIVFNNIDASSSTSPLVDSYIGVTQQMFGQSGTPLDTIAGLNPFWGIQATNTGGRKAVVFEEPSSGASQLNWAAGFGVTGTANAYQIVPSTSNGGFSFTNPVLTCTNTLCSMPAFGPNNLLISSTSPTISGFGTSPSVVISNGTAAFQINVGTGGTATTGTILLPLAQNGWSCQVTDMNNNIVTRETAFTTTNVTLTAASAWHASDKLLVNCAAF